MKIEQESSKCPHTMRTQENDSDNIHNDNTIADIQNTWHVKGNNGCIFSQVIASNVERYNWKKTIIGSLDQNTPEQVDSVVNDAITNPEIRLLSLIFPTVKSVENLRDLCEMLSTVTQTIFLLEDKYVDGLVALSYRTGLDNGQVLAWIMGFGPYDFFAQTRQAPFTEFVIPVKQKPDNTYHRHNQDKTSAHVADQHIPLDDKVLDRIWVNTFKKTEKTLGHKPNIFSGARTTVTLPESQWQKKVSFDNAIVTSNYSDEI